MEAATRRGEVPFESAQRAPGGARSGCKAPEGGTSSGEALVAVFEERAATAIRTPHAYGGATSAVEAEAAVREYGCASAHGRVGA